MSNKICNVVKKFFLILSYAGKGPPKAVVALVQCFKNLLQNRLQTSKLTYVFVALRADVSFVSLSAHKGVVMLFD